MKKVLVTSRSFGKVSSQPLDILKDAGCEVTLMGADFDEKRFKAVVADYDALIIGAHKFYPQDMARCAKLQIIAKHGAGLDNIFLDEARAQGVTVTNVPAMNAGAVADLAMAHMLNLCRGVSRCAAGVKSGRWQTFVGRDLHKKTLGLIGFGAIAKNVARRARGFEMQVLVYDPYISEVPAEFADYVKLVTLEEVIAGGDFISIHVPLSDETRDLLNKESMLRMKEGAYLINTARGGIVNEADLYEVLKSGHLAGAALDVTVSEPIEADNPLLTLDNVVITPHIGMYSFEAINAVSMVCAQNVVKKLAGETPDYVVV